LYAHSSLRYLSTLFSMVFLGFGVTYIVYPRLGYSLSGFTVSSTNNADAELMDCIMVLYGAKDLFMAVAIMASIWYGTRKSAGMMMAASACAQMCGG
ncbi:hypothetical protein P153DRAFT_265152, partial [Dothidotthia symphoricarpi CBS 119687]